MRSCSSLCSRVLQVEFTVSADVAPVLMVPIHVPGETEESGMTSGLVVALGDLEVFFIVLPVPTPMGGPTGRVPLSRKTIQTDHDLQAHHGQPCRCGVAKPTSVVLDWSA